MASRRYGRYLSADWRGRPKLDTAKVKAAEKFDGKFVVITNDDTLSAEDIALGYKGAWIIESCFRRMKQTGLEVRPIFHWTARRIEGARQALRVGTADAAGRRDPVPASVGADRARARRPEGGALPLRKPDYCSADKNLCGAVRDAENSRNISAQADPRGRRTAA